MEQHIADVKALVKSSEEMTIAREEWAKINAKCLKTGEEKYLTKYLHDYIKLCHEQNEKPWFMSKHEWKCRHDDWCKTEVHMKHLRDKSRCQWMWIGVNLPPNEERLSRLQQGISIWLKRTACTDIFTKGWYVYEQRMPREKEEKMQDRGEHLHILIKQHRPEMSPAQYIRELAKIFKCNKECIDVKGYKEEYEAQKKLNYILGWKASDAKKKKQIEDISWRLQHNLKPHYEIGGTLTSPLRAPEKDMEIVETLC